MPAPRGVQHKGRSGVIALDKPVRASVLLTPGDAAHKAYADLVTEMGVSNAEVLRQALLELHQKWMSARRSALKEVG